MQPKHIPPFDTKPPFDMKYDQKIPAVFQGSFPPAELIHVVLYLLLKIQADHTLPTIGASFYAIRFFHKSLLNVDPCRHLFIINIFKAAKRATAHKIK